MRTVIASGLVLCLAGTSVAAQATDAPAPGAALAVMGKSFSGGQRASSFHRWGPRVQGRWYAGHRAPGGWVAYRRPARGSLLPRYWMQPGFVISNHAAYGLPTPGYGYGWSRYYDDAVLTDHYGRVYDSRHDLDWDRYDGDYDDGAEGEYRDEPPPSAGLRYDHGAPDDGVTDGGDYAGRWVGTWYGADGRSYSGEYEGRFDGDARPATPYAEPHWSDDGDGPPPPLPYGDVYSLGGGGHVADGYYYPAPTITTVTVQPAVTTTVVEETVSYSSPKAAWKPKARRVRK